MFFIMWFLIFWLSGSIFWGSVFSALWLYELVIDWDWYINGGPPRWVVDFAKEDQIKYGVAYTITKIGESKDQVWFETKPIEPICPRELTDQKGNKYWTSGGYGGVSSVTKYNNTSWNFFGFVFLLARYSWFTIRHIPFTIC